MAKQVQRRRGTTAQHAAFTGALGEVTVDTDRDGPVVHDGTTLGGIIVPTAFELQKQSFQYAAGGGTGDAVTIALTPVPAAYTAGMKVRWKQPANNTGPVTLNVNALGAVALKKDVSVALAADDLVSGGIYEATHDGTNFQLASSAGSGGGLVLLDTADLTAALVADLTGFSAADYIGYKAKGWIRPATDGARPIVQVSVGGVFITTGYTTSHLSDTPAWVVGNADGSMLPGGTNPLSPGNDADNAFEFEFEWGALDGTRRYFMWGWQSWIGAESTGIQYGPFPARAAMNSAPLVDGLRFRFHIGNIAACRIALLGIAGA